MKTNTVGTNFLIATSTDAPGSRIRGNAVLRISRPPPVTDLTAWRSASVTKWYANKAAIRCAKKSMPPVFWRMMSTSTKYTHESSSGLSSSQTWPTTVSKCCERRLVRASSNANSRRFHSSRMYGRSGGRPTRCGS